MPEPGPHDAPLAAQIRAALLRLEILPLNLGAVDKAGRTGLQRVSRMGFMLATPQSYPLFHSLAEKPEGWSVDPIPPQGERGSGSALWHWLLDALGRKRATIFYFAGNHGIGGSPAAAHLAAMPRFAVFKLLGQANYPVGAVAYDAGRPIWRFGRLPDLIPDDFRTSGERSAAAARRNAEFAPIWAEAVAWLRERAPEFEDPSAYWDDDLKLPEQENPLG